MPRLLLFFAYFSRHLVDSCASPEETAAGVADSTIIKVLLIFAAFLVGLAVGLVTGVIKKLGGASLSAAFIIGGAAFAGTVALLVTIFIYVWP
jgi:hypothetical protein